MASVLQGALAHTARNGSNVVPGPIRMIYGPGFAGGVYRPPAHGPMKMIYGYAGQSQWQPGVYNAYRGKRRCNRNRMNHRRGHSGYAGHDSCCESCANGGPCTGG